MGKREQKRITIPKEKEQYAVEEIVRYFQRERQEELGNLEALALLAVLLECVGPHIYNQAITDALEFMGGKVEELYGLMVL